MRYLTMVLLVVVTAGLTACGGNAANTPLPPAGDERPTLAAGEFDPDPFSTPLPDDAQTGIEPIPPETLAAINAPFFPTAESTQAPFGGVPVQPGDLPPVGEIGYGSDADPDIDLIFDEVRLVRSGGPTNNTLDLQIFQDGSVLRDGQLFTNIGPQGVIELDTRLDEINIFEIRGLFAASNPPSGAFQYALTVNRAGVSITFQMDDRLMPAPLSLLVSDILNLAAPRNEIR